MSDKFQRIPVVRLLSFILNEKKKFRRIFGIPESIFFNPDENKNLELQRFNQLLHNPVGVAAGPHTQLAQNIITAWLTGARYIELKTVQELDELEISKPCIDMQDEGYNCEWSQELLIKDSFDEYLNAWIIIHVLNHELGFNGDIGTIFNMSVGYNLEGIKSDKIDWFFNKIKDCKPELDEKIKEIKSIYPEITAIEIPATISDNITLSTMHGCPPDEILEIGKYLLNEKKLHTSIKLNPTLLGTDLRTILNDELGFETIVPDIAFEHDLKYNDAIAIIKELQEKAYKNCLFFGLKLTNTLESLNHKEIFDKSNEMMFMSGRALHPLAISLARKLQHDFNGKLDISFSAGADCFNIHEIIACNLMPVTVCTDLLKPGGYGRLYQYFQHLKVEFENKSAISIFDFILKQNNEKSITEATLNNLDKYAKKVTKMDAYKKTGFIEPSIKTERELGYFDCIEAPCTDTCPTHQDIPEYLFHASNGNFDKAYEVIMQTNPFPSVTGMVCDHLCQTRCTRINYDHSLLIREVKRYIAENTGPNHNKLFLNKTGMKAAVIGAGPAGLSCAHFLTLAGFEVNVYESKNETGGMVSGAIPSFRLTDEAIQKDIERIEKLGVIIHRNSFVNQSKFEKLRKENDYIFIGVGAQKSSILNIPGINSEGVLDPLNFLFNVKTGRKTGIGKNVAIIGGGNTAMDAARTAYRQVGKNGNVTVVYRRTKAQMPADLGEIKAVIEEGVEIMELVSPEFIEKEKENLILYCTKMKLGDKDISGRRKSVKVPDSEFSMKFDTIIPAIGQDLDIDFADNKQLKTETGSYRTLLEKVYIGGDAMRGASTAINAIADGRKAAEEIIKDAKSKYRTVQIKARSRIAYNDHILKRIMRHKPVKISEIPLSERQSFKLVSSTLSRNEVVTESSRCLYCDEVCNICETVCPNRANYAYSVEPVNIRLQKAVRKNGSLAFEMDKGFNVNQKVQIVNIADWCNECGNCTTFCPTKNAPFKEKPRFHLSIESFENEEEGYFIENSQGPISLYYKSGGEITKLLKNEDHYIFENSSVKAGFNREDFSLKFAEFKTTAIREYKFTKAAEMYVLLENASDFLIY